MDIREQIVGSVFEINKSLSGIRKIDRRLDKSCTTWLDDLSKSVAASTDETIVQEAIVDISSMVSSLLAIGGSPTINSIIGRALTQLVAFESRVPRSRAIMTRLLGAQIAERAGSERKKLLVIIPATASTKAAWFEGIERMAVADIQCSLDEDDSPSARATAIAAWVTDQGFNLADLSGIACRSGFFKPVPTGTYRVVPDMLTDVEHSNIDHPSNLSLATSLRLAEMTGHPDTIMLTTSDPSVSDELETVERLTGYVRIKREGTGAHYLNHKAVIRVLASLLDRPRDQFNAVTAHLGNGISIALQRNGVMSSVVDAFSGVAAAHRCGPLDLQRLIEELKSNEINIKELERVLFTHGGLMSLAGTDDFRALDAFRHKGATEQQQKKIDLIFEFFARQITAAMLKVTADGKPVEIMGLTGGLLRSEELVGRIRNNIAGRYPLVLVPESLEHEALAAGLIRGFADQTTIRDYVKERNSLAQKRSDENDLIDTTIFERKVIYRKKNAPVLSIDELIDATCITVREHYLPTIAIVGANNEEAMLAAKRANEEGNYRIAKFKLVGDSAAINQLAYDFDITIDNDNFSIVDTDNPVEEAVKLIETGEAHILMKGKMHTEHILRGVFQYFKASGRLKPGELMSHVFVMDIPVRNKLLLITDAAVNTYPDEEKRVKIIENSLRVAKNLNIVRPKVAVISAIEAVNKSIESSIQAQRIAERFADRTDCIVEGPLSFDVAMDQNIAHEKNYKGQIGGTADILIMPDIDAGNVLYKSLTTQSKAVCAGVILCGDMPLVLTSRGDSARSKLASISLAVKMYLETR